MDTLSASTKMKLIMNRKQIKRQKDCKIRILKLGQLSLKKKKQTSWKWYAQNVIIIKSISCYNHIAAWLYRVVNQINLYTSKISVEQNSDSFWLSAEVLFHNSLCNSVSCSGSSWDKKKTMEYKKIVTFYVCKVPILSIRNLVVVLDSVTMSPNF